MTYTDSAAKDDASDRLPVLDQVRVVVTTAPAEDATPPGVDNPDDGAKPPAPKAEIVVVPLGGGAAIWLWIIVTVTATALIGLGVWFSVVEENLDFTVSQRVEVQSEDPTQAQTTTITVDNGVPLRFAIFAVATGIAIVAVGVGASVTEATGERYALWSKDGVLHIGAVNKDTQIPAPPGGGNGELKAQGGVGEAVVGAVTAIASTIKDARSSVAIMLVGVLITLLGISIVWTSGDSPAVTDEQAPATTSTTEAPSTS